MLALLFLGVAPASARRGRTSAPRPPRHLVQTARTIESIGLAWRPARRSGRATRYVIYRNGRRLASTARRRRVVKGLACGHSYRFAVAARNRTGRRSRRIGRWMSTAACPVPEDQTPPTISGKAEVGSTLTATTGTWTSSPTSFAFSWSRCDLNGAACVVIPGATTDTFSPIGNDLLGATVRVEVTATNGWGSNRASSQQSDEVRPPSTANLFVVPSGGSPSCTRSPVLVTYDEAVAAGNVCGPGNGVLGYSTNAWNNACKAAANRNTSAGTVIGVKAGTYSQDSDGSLVKDTDCSGGLGAAVNPNAADQGVSTGTTAAWAKYVCADGTAKNVHFRVGGVAFMYASLHLVVQGACFDFNTTINFGQGGATASRRVQNVQVMGDPGCAIDPASSDCLSLYGLSLKGAKNILLENVNYGPHVICGKNDPIVPAAYRCDPTGPSWQAAYANLGTAGPGCSGNNLGPCAGWVAVNEQPEAYIHAGDGSNYENVRIDNVYFHDSSTKLSGSQVHPGCFMMDNNLQDLPANNLVFDHIVCERVASVGVQESDSGVTIENSVFSCPTYALDQAPGGSWDSCANTYEFGLACRADQLPGCVVSNVLIRYNDFITPGASSGLLLQTGGTFGTLRNVRVVGNIFGASLTCGRSGVSYDSNSFVSGFSSCGTNATLLAPGDPFLQSSVATPGNSWSPNSLLNAHPNGTPALPAVDATSGDLRLDHDADGAARTSATHPGAYN